jgi:hypothetical protein
MVGQHGLIPGVREVLWGGWSALSNAQSATLGCFTTLVVMTCLLSEVSARHGLVWSACDPGRRRRVVGEALGPTVVITCRTDAANHSNLKFHDNDTNTEAGGAQDRRKGLQATPR